MTGFRLEMAVLALAAITLAGTVGYVAIEGVPAVDALYMTVVTISTVGYREMFPLSREGQWFTMALIIVGVGSGLYLLSVLAQSVLEGQLRDLYRRNLMSKRIGNIEDHVIVCGFGRFGRVVTNELLGAGRQVVVIEQDPELEPELDRIDVAYLIGSATSDELLEVAGIRRASAIVIAVASESDCVFVALASHELNPEITIHARGESDAAVRRLRRAGAHHVTSPLQMGGMRAAASILRPNVVDFLELSAPSGGQAIDLEEIQLERGSPLHGSDLKAIESELPLLRVVALKRGGEPLTLVPRDMVVEGGDLLVAIGNREQLAILAEKAQRSSH